MKNTHSIAIMGLLVFLWIQPLSAEERATVFIPGVGETKIVAHMAKKGSTLPPFLVLETSSGKRLKRVDFSLRGLSDPDYPSALRFKAVHPAKDALPLVVAVASSVGGSTIHYETAIIGVVEDSITELIPAHIESASLDALCFEISAGRAAPDLLFFGFLWENEAHYDPHRYEVTIFHLTGDGFVKAGTRKTTKKYTSWIGAADELGYRCRDDLITGINRVYE